MRKYIPVYIRFPFFYLIVFALSEYFIDSGDRPAFVKYPIVPLIHLLLIFIFIFIEVIVNAVEVWQPYIDQFDLVSRYDKLFAMDVRDMDNFAYDLVILGDILEHMSEEDAVSLWEKISKQAKHAMISIPIIHYHQDAINGNPYEVHVEEDWTMERVLEKFSHIIEHKKFEVTGTFIAEFNNDNS
jgi:hypothetical protein